MYLVVFSLQSCWSRQLNMLTCVLIMSFSDFENLNTILKKQIIKSYRAPEAEIQLKEALEG